MDTAAHGLRDQDGERSHHVDQKIRLAEQEAPMARAGVVLGYRMSGTSQQPWDTGRGDEARPAGQAWLALHWAHQASLHMHACTYKVLPSAVRNKDCEWSNAGFLVAPPKLSRDKRDELALGAFGPIQQSPGQGARARGTAHVDPPRAPNAHWLAWCWPEPAGSSFLVTVSCVGTPGLRACTLRAAFFRAVRGSGSQTQALLWLRCQATRLPSYVH